MKKNIIEDDVYKTTFVVALGNTQELARFAERMMGESFTDAEEARLAGAAGMTFNFLPAVRSIFLMFDSDSVDLSTHRGAAVVTHEVSHATAIVMRGVGIPFTEDSEEAHSYYHEWLFERVMDSLVDSSTRHTTRKAPMPTFPKPEAKKKAAKKPMSKKSAPKKAAAKKCAPKKSAKKAAKKATSVPAAKSTKTATAPKTVTRAKAAPATISQ